MSTQVEWTMKVPVLSMAHLPFEVANEHISSDFEGPEGLTAVLFPGGMMLYAEDDCEGDLSEALAGICRWAKDNGYDWVRFDQDGVPR